MKRLVMASGTVLAIAFAVGIQACSSSDNTGGSTPTNSGGTGNASSSGGSGNATASGGTVGMSGSTSVAGTGGSLSAGGMSAAGGTGPGGATAAGGASGSTSAAGASGATGTAGAGGGGAAPAPCDASVAKAGACTTAGSVCSKTCGPDKVGYKTETCTAGAYAEGVCTFPPGGSYTCYQKPVPLVACAGAPAAGPVASTACTAAACMPCGPAYQDSKMNPKMGACVCTSGKWSCASDAEWPPQM